MNVKIRRAKVKDVPQMLVLGQEFWETTKYFSQGVPYNYDTVHNLTVNLIQGGVVQLAEDSDTQKVVGFILCVIVPFPFNSDYKSATEMAFYVSPDYRASGAGKALVKQAENVCTQLGIKFLTMVELSTSPKHTGRFYSQLGYQRSETSHTKDLG